MIKHIKGISYIGDNRRNKYFNLKRAINIPKGSKGTIKLAISGQII